MILPNNGKVVIIDDIPSEVEDLMFALTKEKMPFLFFSERDGEDLPEEGSPVENVRLVFLDLDLGIAGNDTSKIRTIQGRIEKIIAPHTPYILVIWSTKEERYARLLMEEFNGTFSAYKPIESCSLDKARIKAMGDDPKVVIEHIRTELRNQLSQFNSFNAFLLWESIVNKSSGEISNGFTRIFDFNDSWDTNINAFFYRLAKANVGEERIDKLSDDQKLQLSLETINSALIDSIEKNIKLSSKELNISINEVGANITANNLISINTKLHLLHTKDLDHFQSGNVYYKEYSDVDTIRSIVEKSFNGPRVADIMNSVPQFIQVDVTPGCDYTQDKGYVRLLGGIIVKANFYPDKKRQSQMYIYNQCPILNINEEGSFMIFDFRSFKSFKKETFEKMFRKPAFKIRSQLLIDLQAGLSNHINRPGIISVE